jgi:hypothetical protein
MHTCPLRATPRTFFKISNVKNHGCFSDKQVHSQHGSYFGHNSPTPIISICIYVSHPELVASRDGGWTGISRALGFLVIYHSKSRAKHHVHSGKFRLSLAGSSNLYLLIETLAFRHRIQVHHFNATIPNTSTKV